MLLEPNKGATLANLRGSPLDRFALHAYHSPRTLLSPPSFPQPSQRARVYLFETRAGDTAL